MTDFFAELGFQPCAWLDAEKIKSHHHQRIASIHPDKPGGDTSMATRANEARRVLESPPRRLRHLIELLAPDFSPTTKPSPDWDLFSTIGENTREASLVAKQIAGTSSPIVRAGLLVALKACEAQLAQKRLLIQEYRERLEHDTRALILDPLDAPFAFSLAEQWTFLDRLAASLRKAETELKTAGSA